MEGFEIFDKMIDEIRKMIVRRVINVRVERCEERTSRTASASVATHQESSQFASHNPTGPVQVVRTAPKVGRNDPCPCGSGKKYKHCHGA